jgi:hypothetical protein
MQTGQIIFVIAIFLLIVASIVLGDVFFTYVLGVDVSKLPPFFKFLVHSAGGIVVGYVAFRFFRR